LQRINSEESRAAPTAQRRDPSPASRRNPLQGINPLKRTAGIVLAAALLYGAWLGAEGRVPVGSDHGAYDGLRELAVRLQNEPAEAVIYHHSLGWYYDFYLFDAPQERRWYGTPWKLADDASATAIRQSDRPQWLALPEWEISWLEALRLPLAGRGLALAEVERIYRADGSTSFRLFRIVAITPQFVP
jgi:hypothetical protein